VNEPVLYREVVSTPGGAASCRGSYRQCRDDLSLLRGNRPIYYTWLGLRPPSSQHCNGSLDVLSAKVGDTANRNGVEGISWGKPSSWTDPAGEACDDEVHSPFGRRCRGRVSSDSGCDGRGAGSRLGAMRPQLVAQCVDQRVQTATAAATVVQTPAAVCAEIRTAVGAAAPSSAAVGAVCRSGVGSGASTVGRLGRPGLGADLTVGRLRGGCCQVGRLRTCGCATAAFTETRCCATTAAGSK
jgi:hypothetical protein